MSHINIMTIKKDDKKYFLSAISDDNHPPFFLRNEEGEGMSLTEEQLFEIFDKYFEENL